MWTPYFCIIWPCPHSEIQRYIPHNRLKRLDFSFGHSVFSLLMVNSKGGSSSNLILFSGMKSTSKFPDLKSKAVFGCFLPFSKICFSGLLWCSMVITYSQGLKDRGGGLWNNYYLPKLRGRQTNFSRPFQPCFQIFREHGKVYPNKTYL